MNPTTNSRTDVLIACPPGALRTGLQALLEALPWVGSVQTAGSVTALRDRLASSRPELVIVADTFAEQPLEAVLAAVSQGSPGSRVAVLREQSGSTEPLGSASLVLPQGTVPAELVSALERLVSGRND